MNELRAKGEVFIWIDYSYGEENIVGVYDSLKAGYKAIKETFSDLETAKKNDNEIVSFTLWGF